MWRELAKRTAFERLHVLQLIQLDVKFTTLCMAPPALPIGSKENKGAHPHLVDMARELINMHDRHLLSFEDGF